MAEVKVDKQYFDIEIDDNDNIISDYKIKSGVSKKHLALKLLKKKGFDYSIIADAEYLYEKLQGFDTKKKDDGGMADFGM
jgi:DNA mismatch repair ATPase MutS